MRKFVAAALGCAGLMVAIGTALSATVLYLAYLVIQKM